MAAYKHSDEARRDAITALDALLTQEAVLERAVLIDDLFGKLRVVLWPSRGADEQSTKAMIDRTLGDAAQRFWSGDIWVCNDVTSTSDRLVYDAAWDEAKRLSEKLRLDDRHRNHTAWFAGFREPPWPAGRDAARDRMNPSIVVFFSFKGGVGRSTALAAFAIRRARQGEDVSVIDFDLDAPGVGTLLAADEQGTTARWGVVDYLLERQHGPVPWMDYVHRCARPEVTGDSGIWVVPAGRLDEDYLTKLSRVDLEVSSLEAEHPLELLLHEVRDELAPRWILIDARAGISPAAGLLLSGFAHLHVLIGTTSEQSFQGLARVVHHLGAERLNSKVGQADCVVVQSMVPDSDIIAREAQRQFTTRMEEIFTEHYLVSEDDVDPEDRIWSVRDLDNVEAPHKQVVVPYRDRFAFFQSIDAIADELATWEPYGDLEDRILGRFPALDSEEAETD